MEYEIIALATTTIEAGWSKCLLVNIYIWEKLIPTIFIYFHNIATIEKN